MARAAEQGGAEVLGFTTQAYFLISCGLAVLVSASLKFDGRVMVQAQGDGPVSLMVAEARSDGGVAVDRLNVALTAAQEAAA